MGLLLVHAGSSTSALNFAQQDADLSTYVAALERTGRADVLADASLQAQDLEEGSGQSSGELTEEERQQLLQEWQQEEQLRQKAEQTVLAKEQELLQLLQQHGAPVEAEAEAEVEAEAESELESEAEEGTEAALNIYNTPTYMEAYIERIMQGALQDGLPEVLLPGQEPLTLEGFLAQERMMKTDARQRTANKLLYDTTNEALANLYKAANRVKAPWASSRKRIMKPMLPPKDLVAEVQKQVLDWSRASLRGKEDMEGLKAAAAAEIDRTWYATEEEEEVKLKFEISDDILTGLIMDTARVVAELPSKP
ncbi:hypothetical protein DUNSADRAFT_2453 [Dunaliella salina]|uniref:DUF4378 domain-containing protein n=1 Tax=Dunaliella salina TaxID=3046 RepID=A0ABQ7FWL8_DUNSA|nr:hypothetical protein DUNSADRAFT_2453 [Dunaliella salina]|eukprot:KAF5826647.1 hypothetical protein DUNSADRAFT_2453 [Dunaliella salina]